MAGGKKSGCPPPSRRRPAAAAATTLRALQPPLVQRSGAPRERQAKSVKRRAPVKADRRRGTTAEDGPASVVLQAPAFAGPFAAAG